MYRRYVFPSWKGRGLAHRECQLVLGGGGVGRMFDGRGGAKLRSRVGVLVEIEAISRLKPEDDELRSQSGTATSFFMRVLGGIVG